jgi:hypothetical protein
MWTLLPSPCFCKLLLFSTRFPDAKTINTTVVNCSRPSLFAGSFVRVCPRPPPPNSTYHEFSSESFSITYTRLMSQLSGVLPWPHTPNISRSLESLFCIFGLLMPPKRKTSHVINVRDAVKRQKVVPNSIEIVRALYSRLHGLIWGHLRTVNLSILGYACIPNFRLTQFCWRCVLRISSLSKEPVRFAKYCWYDKLKSQV